MTVNPNANSSMNTGRSLLAKYEVHNARSGEVSAGLRGLPDCADFYAQLQQSESALREARKAWDSQASAHLSSRTVEEKLRRQVVTMARAAVSISEAADVSGLRDILAADDSDEASMASRLAHDLRSVPLVGEAIASALLTLRQELLAAEAKNQAVKAAFEAATRDFGHAYYRASAVLAQGKAMLFASGIKVSDRKINRRSRKKAAGGPTTVPEQPAPSSEPPTPATT